MNDKIKVSVATIEDISKIKDYILRIRETDITVVLGSMLAGLLKEEEFINHSSEYSNIMSTYNLTNIPKVDKSMNLTIRPVIESRQLVDYLTYSLYDGSYPFENYDIYSNKDIVSFGYYPTDIMDLFVTELGSVITSKSKLIEKYLISGKSFTFNYSNSPQEPLRLQTFPEYEYDEKTRFIKCKTHLYPFNKLLKSKINHNETIYKDKDNVLVRVSKIRWYIDRENGRLICLTPLICGIDTFCYDSNNENHVLNKYLNEVFFKDLTQDIDLNKMLNTTYDKEKLDEEISMLPCYRVLEEYDYKLIREIGIDEFIKLERDKYKNTEYVNNPFSLVKQKETIKTYIDLDVPLIVISNLVETTFVNELMDKFKYSNVYNITDAAFYLSDDYTTSKYIDKIKSFIEIKSKSKENEVCVFVINVNDYKINILADFFAKYEKPSNARIIITTNENNIYKNNKTELLEDFLLFEYNDSNVNNYDLLNFAIDENVHPILCALICIVGENLCKEIIEDKNKWKAMSKILYSTNNIFLLRNLLGNTLYNILCESYLNKKFISLKDIINRNYDERSLNIKEIDYMQVSYLSLVDEENIETVRNFIIQTNPKLLNYFDSLWSRNNNDRKKILEELSKTNNMVLRK